MAKSKAWRDYDFDRMGEGQLFFYVGAGLSQAAGLVGWNEMAAAISRLRREYEGDVSDRCSPHDEARENAAYLRRFVEEKDSDGNLILSRDSTDVRTFARTVFLNFLLRCRRSDLGGLQTITEGDLGLHHAVWNTRCQGVFTTNYDMLLEEAFGLLRPSERQGSYGHPAALRTYRYYARFLPFLLSVPRFVLKLHGDVDDIGTMLFDPETAWDRETQLGGQAGQDLCRVFDSALRAGHMIYIGCGGRDRTFRELHGWRGRTHLGPYERLFFVPSSELAALVKEMGPATDDLLFLTYGSPENRPDPTLAAFELHEFLGELIRCAKSRPMYFSNEAANLWSQLKTSSKLRRDWLTPLWNVSGRRPPKSWERGRPQVAGLYLWRRREGNARPFLASVEEWTDWWGDCLSVYLEGREILWRDDQPWAPGGRPPDEEFLSYEWVGPLDE